MAAILFNITAIILSVVLENGGLLITSRSFIVITGVLLIFNGGMLLWAVWPPRPPKLPPGYPGVRPPRGRK